MIRNGVGRVWQKVSIGQQRSPEIQLPNHCPRLIYRRIDVRMRITNINVILQHPNGGIQSFPREGIADRIHRLGYRILILRTGIYRPKKDRCTHEIVEEGVLRVVASVGSGVLNGFLEKVQDGCFINLAFAFWKRKPQIGVLPAPMYSRVFMVTGLQFRILAGWAARFKGDRLGGKVASGDITECRGQPIRGRTG